MNPNMDEAPKDEPLIIASECGKVIKSYWVKPTKTEGGRWAGFSVNSKPDGWWHWPKHPRTQA